MAYMYGQILKNVELDINEDGSMDLIDRIKKLNLDHKYKYEYDDYVILDVQDLYDYVLTKYADIIEVVKKTKMQISTPFSISDAGIIDKDPDCHSEFDKYINIWYSYGAEDDINFSIWGEHYGDDKFYIFRYPDDYNKTISMAESENYDVISDMVESYRESCIEIVHNQHTGGVVYDILSALKHYKEPIWLTLSPFKYQNNTYKVSIKVNPPKVEITLIPEYRECSGPACTSVISGEFIDN